MSSSFALLRLRHRPDITYITSTVAHRSHAHLVKTMTRFESFWQSAEATIVIFSLMTLSRIIQYAYNRHVRHSAHRILHQRRHAERQVRRVSVEEHADL